MNENLPFRIAIAVLVLVGAAILLVTWRGQHLPRDNEVLPRVPAGAVPPPART